MGFSLEAVREAHRLIQGLARTTPLVEALSFSDQAGQPILLKLETLQPIGAFKIRGAAHALLRLDEAARRRGVVCCSTGNHGKAVAYAARHLGIKATICLSNLVPEAKVQGIAAQGATIRRCGTSQDDAQREADRLVREKGYTDISPFDHRNVILGQATIALELLTECPDLTQIVVPLSGGGLLGGIAVAAKQIKPSIRVTGVSMAEGAAMHESLKAGHPIHVAEAPSLADTLGGGINLTNQWTFKLCCDFADETLLVSEEEIYRGMQALFRRERLIAEGGGAVGIAALLAGKLKLDGPTAMIISGQNADLDQIIAVAKGEPVRVGDRMVKG
ncbi:hydroxyectoine utilization dehydratase EutB [Taklimakanibacter albus]|uniref:Hydroxyectoine utilization dehydratase EutB n=1 Tax=Taklimakanibacter albus TaxID=2800327 RepID=A0ACC5R890_9HYPH|nr:hydroxyectoine utilization dehydratase EutB [Aestuariivirga sp. YIM B02566]MBK1868857.1 hydroxyectoine utilization dehydratase EutB [Aestuariivirga sp. YIM B02566]